MELISAPMSVNLVPFQSDMTKGLFIFKRFLVYMSDCVDETPDYVESQASAKLSRLSTNAGLGLFSLSSIAQGWYLQADLGDRTQHFSGRDSNPLIHNTILPETKEEHGVHHMQTHRHNFSRGVRLQMA